MGIFRDAFDYVRFAIGWFNNNQTNEAISIVDGALDGYSGEVGWRERLALVRDIDMVLTNETLKYSSLNDIPDKADFIRKRFADFLNMKDIYKRMGKKFSDTVNNNVLLEELTNRTSEEVRERDDRRESACEKECLTYRDVVVGNATFNDFNFMMSGERIETKLAILKDVIKLNKMVEGDYVPGSSFYNPQVKWPDLKYVIDNLVPNLLQEFLFPGRKSVEEGSFLKSFFTTLETVQKKQQIRDTERTVTWGGCFYATFSLRSWS